MSIIILGHKAYFTCRSTHARSMCIHNPVRVSFPCMRTLYLHNLSLTTFAVKALYGSTGSGTFDYVSYIYILAPISLVIINPIGFVLMEYSKQTSTSRFTCKKVSQWVVMPHTLLYSSILAVDIIIMSLSLLFRLRS